jgi:hypothetical protein
MSTSPRQSGAALALPPDVFENLVSAWVDILVADYRRRHSRVDPAASEYDAAAARVRH